MFDIRLRLYSDKGDRGRVIPTSSITYTGGDSTAATLSFSISEGIVGALTVPFLVGVEYTSGSGGYQAPRGDMFIVTKLERDHLSTAKRITYTGTEFVPWLLARHFLKWGITPWLSGAPRPKDGMRNFNSPGHLMRTMILEAQHSGWGPGVTFDFTDTRDSLGATWQSGENPAPMQCLVPMWQHLTTITEQGLAHWWTEGRKLRLFRPGVGANKTDIVLGGNGFTAAPMSEDFDDVLTAVTVVYDDGAKWVNVDNASADTSFGQLFGVMTQSGVEKVTDAQRLAGPTLAEARAKKREIGLDWSPRGNIAPWVHFRIGDTVMARTSTGKIPQRVIGLVITKEQNDVTARVVLGSRLTRKPTKLAAVSAKTTVGTIVGGSGTPIPVNAAPKKPAPQSPTALRVELNSPWWSQTGAAGATVVLAWNAVELAMDDSFVDIEQYEVWSRDANGVSRLLTKTNDIRVEIETFRPGVLQLVKARARSTGGVWSDFSPEVSVVPAVPAPLVPKAPTGLTLVSNEGTFKPDGRAFARVKVEWAAVTQTIVGDLVEIKRYEPQVADEDGAWVPLAPVGAERSVVIEMPSGRERSIRIVAQSSRDVRSDPSEVLKVTGALPTQITTPFAVPLLSTVGGDVIIRHNGQLDGGGEPGPSYDHHFAEVSAAPDGPWSKAVAIPARGAGQITTVSAPVGSDLWVRVVWVDVLGRLADPSPAATIRVAGTGMEDLAQGVKDTIDNAVRDAQKASLDVGSALATSLDEYVVTDSSVTPPPADADWSSDTPDWSPGQFVWRRARNTSIAGAVTYSSPVVITGADGTPGEDAILLRVDSSRGTAFKNNAISTVLTVTVLKGARAITNITDLWSVIGHGSYLEWSWRRKDDSDWGVVGSNDPRISQAGFALTVSPADVDEQTSFKCILITP